MFESCYVDRDSVEVFLDQVGVEGLLEVRPHLGRLARKETVVCRGKGDGGGLEGDSFLFTLFELVLLIPKLKWVSYSSSAGGAISSIETLLSLPEPTS